MSVAVQLSFEDYLVSIGMLKAPAKGAAARPKTSYRQLVEETAQEPAAFAEAVAAYHNLPRISLTAMRAGEPLLDRFSPRFLREYAAYPYERGGEVHLALADPSDPAIMRMIELTLGQQAEREVAAFNEIELLLRESGAEAEQENGNGIDAIAADLGRGGDDDDLDLLRDMASGAPVVRTVNELFERAVEV